MLTLLTQEPPFLLGNPPRPDLGHLGLLASATLPVQTFLRTLGIEIVLGREGAVGNAENRITALGENRSLGH
jgi:hypothetical protein